MDPSLRYFVAMKENETDIEVLLVNEKDLPQGTMNKLEAHRKGILHRAFSVLLFDEDGRLLLQQRANEKYHSGGLWTNTCCSHPGPEEKVEEGAARRLKEEMGIDAELHKLFIARYYLELGDGMVENELDHVFYGISNEEPKVDGEEVMDQRFITRKELGEELRAHPERFTEWFKVIWQEFEEEERARA